MEPVKPKPVNPNPPGSKRSPETVAKMSSAQKAACDAEAEYVLPKPKPTPAQQAQQLGEAEATLADVQKEAGKAATAARSAQAAANHIARRLPLPAPVKIITGAPPARGVPRKFNLERQRVYFDALARGISKNDAAKLAGVTRQTLKNYRDADADFKAAEIEAETLATELVEEALFEAARTGNIEAIKVWLFNRAPERWQPIQKLNVQVSGDVSHTINVDTLWADIDALESQLRARVIRDAETPALEAGVTDAELLDEG